MEAETESNRVMQITARQMIETVFGCLHNAKSGQISNSTIEQSILFASKVVSAFGRFVLRLNFARRLGFAEP